MSRTPTRERHKFAVKNSSSTSVIKTSTETSSKVTRFREPVKCDSKSGSKVSLPGPGVVELRGWGTGEEPVDLWDYQNTTVRLPGDYTVVCVFCNCQIGVKVDVRNIDIEDHLAGNHHRQTVSDLQCLDMENKHSCVKVCYCSQHAGDAEEQQSSSKRLKLLKPESSQSGDKNSRHSLTRNNKEENAKKFDKTSSKNDYYKDFKNEQVAHLATKEQVKLLKTKVNCLNSDVGELQSQLADMEEKVIKVKKEGASKVQDMKQYLVKKQGEIENLKAALYGDNPMKLDCEELEKQKTLTAESNKTKILTAEAAVQTEGRSVESSKLGSEEYCKCFDQKREGVPEVSEQEEFSKVGKLEDLEDISVLVEEVLMENTKVMQVNATFDRDNTNLLQVNNTLETKSKERKNAHKVFLNEFDKYKDATRELQAKLLRLTVENMKLKKENHEARSLLLSHRSGDEY